MRENYRNSIASIKKFPQFTTMHVIDGQAGLIICASLIFYSLTIDNILNIIVLLILAGVSISLTLGKNGVLIQATNAVSNSREATAKEDVEMAWASATTKYWSDWASNSSKQRNEKFYKDELEGKETSNGRIEEITLSGSIYTVLYTDNDQGDLYTFEIGLDGNATQTDKEKANTV